MAVRLLVEAANASGTIEFIHGIGGYRVFCGTVQYSGSDRRTLAEYEHAVRQLQSHDLIDGTERPNDMSFFQLTHEGYLLADELIAIVAE